MVKVAVINTNEELMIAQDVMRIALQNQKVSPCRLSSRRAKLRQIMVIAQSP